MDPALPAYTRSGWWHKSQNALSKKPQITAVKLSRKHFWKHNRSYKSCTHPWKTRSTATTPGDTGKTRRDSAETPPRHPETPWATPTPHPETPPRDTPRHRRHIRWHPETPRDTPETPRDTPRHRPETRRDTPRHPETPRDTAPRQDTPRHDMSSWQIMHAENGGVSQL